MDDLRSLRCSRCSAYWPPEQGAYGRCPECLGPTWPSVHDPVAEDHARSRKNHADFERWLDKHDRRGPVELLEQIPVRDA